MEYALEAANQFRHVARASVLILVLMEYALEVTLKFNSLSEDFLVLILVLMEYALEVTKVTETSSEIIVLILVLMEYALEGGSVVVSPRENIRLNPCFNGICSRRLPRLPK